MADKNGSDYRRTTGGRENDRRKTSGYGTKPQVRYVRRVKAPVRKFTTSNRMKLVMVFSVIVVAMTALIIRLNYINMTKGSDYSKQVLSQMNYDGQQIPYRRGDIVDRNGTVLATSEKVYNLVVDAYVMQNSKVEKEGDCLEPTMQALRDFFGGTGINIDEIRTYVTDNPESRYHVVVKHLSYETVQPYNDYFAVDEDGEYINEDAPYIKGIWFEEEYVRKYPYGDLAGDVIGFTYSGNVGAYGLEAYYNDALNGTNGREYGYLDEGMLERSVVSPTNGNTIVTTLDINVMQIVHKHLMEFNEAFGSLNSAVIVQKADTGEILAMESYPFMDCNDPYDISDYVTEEFWNSLTDEEKMIQRQAIWRNFCVSDTYEPGSTVKTVTVANALDEGYVTPSDTFYCDGGLTFPDGDKELRVKCISQTGHGKLTLSGAIEHSCNAALMTIGLKMGRAEMVEMWDTFGLGLKTNIDLPGESSGIIRNETMSTLDLAICSFGQSYNVTMVQVASAFASIVNGGNFYRPHLVSQIQSENGSTVQSFDKELVRTTVSSTTSEWMKGALEATVASEDASGHLAYIEGYRIGGKTGTAEKIPRDSGKYLVSFISCAPVNDPEIIVYVAIDEPSTNYGADSGLPTILTRKIYEDLLPYLQIFPEGIEQETDETDETDDWMTSDTDESIASESESESDSETAQTMAGEEDNFQETDTAVLTEEEIAQLRRDYLSGRSMKNSYMEKEYIRE